MNEIEKTKQLLEKWTLPVGEEKEIKVEIGDDELYFKARILSAKEIAEIRAMSINQDGTVDMVMAEKSNNELIRRAIVEPEVDPEKLHPILRDLLLSELLKAHGYSEDIISKLEKKFGRRDFGSISPTSSESRK